MYKKTEVFTFELQIVPQTGRSIFIISWRLLYTVETGILVNYLSYTARYIFFLYFLSDTENAGIFLCRNSPMKAYLFSETAECRYISFQKKPNAYIQISFQKQPKAGSFFFSETAQCRHISFQKQPNAGIFLFRKSPMQVHFFYFFLPIIQFFIEIIAIRYIQFLQFQG